MNIAILAVASLSLAVSCATLAIVLVGGKRAQTEMDAFKATAEDKRQKVKTALEGLL